MVIKVMFYLFNTHWSVYKIYFPPTRLSIPDLFEINQINQSIKLKDGHKGDVLWIWYSLICLQDLFPSYSTVYPRSIRNQSYQSINQIKGWWLRWCSIYLILSDLSTRSISLLLVCLSLIYSKSISENRNPPFPGAD